MEAQLEKQLQEMLDRQAILDCIYRYCSGVDRFDRDLVLSAYHPDAIDDHGEFVGNPEGFVDWAFAYHEHHQASHHHMILNHRCDLDGNTAHTESYWIFMGNNRQAPNTFAVGRYVDRFEKRKGNWAIAARVCVSESVNDLTPQALPEAVLLHMANYGPSTRDQKDISYERPLRIKHPLTIV